jgi:putative SOS response-associated peptidase YedK
VSGRYSNDAEFSDIRARFDISQVELLGDWQRRYNICPTTGAGFEQLFVRFDGVARSIHLGRWGLIPGFWTKPLKSLPTSFNARAEEIASKPFWREPFALTRCLVPATGWREFTGVPGHKQPHHFHLAGQLFAFAGVWSTWRSEQGQAVESFAIVTTEPSPEAAQIHDRMPLVLTEEHEAAWLDPGLDPATVLAAACAKAKYLPLEIYPSNPIGNSGRFDGPAVLERVTPALPKQQKLF